MRIDQIHTSVARLPLLEPWADAQKQVTHLELVVVDVTTDTGLVGTGFTHTAGVGGLTIQSLIKDYYGADLIGRTVVPRALWEYGRAFLHDEGGGGITSMALSALDIAFWDLTAKHVGMPLVDVLGRVRDRIPVYGSGVNLALSLPELLDQVDRWLGNGYRAVKIKVGKDDPEEDIERVTKVRERIGGLRLMVDANQRWDAPEATRRIRALEHLDLLWVEEPMLSDDIASHARLRDQVRIPLATGENAHTLWQFRDLINTGAVDIVQPDIGRVGGITPILDIATLARASSRPIALHFMVELSTDVLCALPNALVAEDVDGGSLTDVGVLARPRRIQDGYSYPADVAGHGLELDRDRLAAHAIG